VINEWVKNYAAKQGFANVDYYVAMAGPDGYLRKDLSADGIHPNDLVYQIMSRSVANAIDQLQKKSKIPR
jgi:lysophospholipase L1-like esterase